MKNYTLCEFECPKCDKCARYLPDLNKSTTAHMGRNPYDYKRNLCTLFEPYDDIEPDPKIIENIMNCIKASQNA